MRLLRGESMEQLDRDGTATRPTSANDLSRTVFGPSVQVGTV